MGACLGPVGDCNIWYTTPIARPGCVRRRGCVCCCVGRYVCCVGRDGGDGIVVGVVGIGVHSGTDVDVGVVFRQTALDGQLQQLVVTEVVVHGVILEGQSF